MTCTAVISTLVPCRQLATLERARDGREIVLRQSDDIAFAQALQQQVSEWLQVKYTFHTSCSTIFCVYLVYFLHIHACMRPILDLYLYVADIHHWVHNLLLATSLGCSTILLLLFHSPPMSTSLVMRRVICYICHAALTHKCCMYAGGSGYAVPRCYKCLQASDTVPTAGKTWQRENLEGLLCAGVH